MPYNEAQLNGSADFRVGLSVEPVSQDGAGNYTTFLVQISLQNPNASPSWTNSTQYWSVNVGGGVYSGTFTIPQSGASTKTRVLDARYINIGHDADGFRPGFQSFASIDTNHSSIGDGTVSLWADAPRIIKRPTPPRNVTLSDATDTGLTVSWLEPLDWKGSGPGGGRYVVRRRQGSASSPQYADYAVAVPATSVRIESLPAGTEQFIEVMAQGSAWFDNGGYSDMSPMQSIMLQAGIYVSDGANWVASSFRVSDGVSTYATLMPKISDGDSWEDPIDV